MNEKEQIKGYCKDCKHRRRTSKYDYSQPKCRYFEYGSEGGVYSVSPNDYCSRFEPKEE